MKNKYYNYTAQYSSPLGRLTLAADEKNLAGLWIEGQKYFGDTTPSELTEKSDLPIFEAAENWLDRYFAGEKPAISDLPLAPVGGTVGHNPISIIIPCHRVVGANGSLTGYSGGIDRKIRLLEHEGVDMSALFALKKGTAL